MLSNGIVVLALVYGCQAGILTSLMNSKIDCLVSGWTDWSTPYGMGQIFRERVVLRQPMNGGKECPIDMRQENRTQSFLPIAEVAKKIEQSFLSPRGFRTKREESTGFLRDILLIVDSSGSITSSGFEEAKTQLARLMSLLCPLDHTQYSTAHRAALLEYSTEAKMIYHFKDKKTTLGVTQGILDMVYMSDNTNTHEAFKLAKEEAFTEDNGMRRDPRVRQEVLIVTDGLSACGDCAIEAARELQDVADVFALVIGSKTDDGVEELQQYVSNPVQDHLFAINSYDVLEELLDDIEALTHEIECFPLDIPDNV